MNVVLKKTMKNIRNCVDLRLVKNHGKALKLAATSKFKQLTIFDENLIAIHMEQTKLGLINWYVVE